MHRYAFVVISNGGEILTFSCPIKGFSDSEILEEVKETHNISDREIQDIVVVSSKNKVEFEQLDLSSVERDMDEFDYDEDDTDVEPSDDYVDDLFMEDEEYADDD